MAATPNVVIIPTDKKPWRYTSIGIKVARLDKNEWSCKNNPSTFSYSFGKNQKLTSRIKPWFVSIVELDMAIVPANKYGQLVFVTYSANKRIGQYEDNFTNEPIKPSIFPTLTEYCGRNRLMSHYFCSFLESTNK